MDLPDCVRLRTAELVALPSVSSLDPALDNSNLAVVERLAAWCAASGFEVEQRTLATLQPKANLIARLGSGDDGLVLAGHTDTVPCAAELWTADPFTLRAHAGRWYGLGVADMKSFFPLALAVVDSIPRRRLRRALTLLATADEETTMSGARALGRELRARYAVIGEPTNLAPVHKHKGYLALRLMVDGRGAHSSDPAQGVNALEGLHTIMSALMEWRSHAGESYRDAEFDVPTPTLNFGRVVAGDSANRICAHAELLFDLRPLPSMNAAAVIAELERLVARAAHASGVRAQLTLAQAPLPAHAIGRHSTLVTTAEAVCGQAARAVAFGTEAPFLSALGIDTIVLGPGDIACAHQADEAVDVAKLDRMAAILRALIERFCCDD
jgi:acetylornithine deacetylase